MSLSTQQQQMLLGTLLGDGWVGFRYQSNHGWKQHEYNTHKAGILKARMPRLRPNLGWGKVTSTFSTPTANEYRELRQFCYPNGTKTVTPEWLSLLTWEGVAYWYMDDGTLCDRRFVSISTHGFTKQENELLVSWLSLSGIDSVVDSTVVKSGRTLYYLRLRYDSSRRFVAAIQPWAHPNLAYKFDVHTPSTVCRVCSVTYQPINYSVVCPTCRTTVATAKQQRRTDRILHREAQVAAKLEARAQRRAARLVRQANRLQLRREHYAALMSDPAYRAAALEKKRLWKLANPLTPEQQERKRQNDAACYQRIKSNPDRYAEMLRLSRERRRTPEAVARQREDLRRWREAHPEKVAEQLYRAMIRRRKKPEDKKPLGRSLSPEELARIPEWQETTGECWPESPAAKDRQKLRTWLRRQTPEYRAAACARVKAWKAKKLSQSSS